MNDEIDGLCPFEFYLALPEVPRQGATGITIFAGGSELLERSL